MQMPEAGNEPSTSLAREVRLTFWAEVGECFGRVGGVAAAGGAAEVHVLVVQGRSWEMVEQRRISFFPSDRVVPVIATCHALDKSVAVMSSEGTAGCGSMYRLLFAPRQTRLATSDVPRDFASEFRRRLLLSVETAIPGLSGTLVQGLTPTECGKK